MAGYGTDDGFEAWLTARGYSLPDDAPEPAVLRQLGSDYIDGLYWDRFPGSPTGGVAQERAWPREDVELYGTELSSSTVPDRVVNASYAAAWYEAQNPGALSVAVTPAAQAKREKVGPIEVEYRDTGATGVASATPLLSMVEAILAPFIAQPAPYIATV
jgi:hypothetical protein